MTKLDGKVAIVTGAAGGIGYATARLFVQEGARVLLVDRESQRVAALASELGPKTSYFGADVTRATDSQAYVAAAVERFGRLDILFANAGVEGHLGTVTELAPEAFDEVLAVNVRGVFLGLKYAIPEIAKQKGGSIVITSSIAGLIGSPGLAAYVTSKHAVIGLMRAAAIETAAQGIRVNTINPGPIDNRMMRGIEGQLSPGHELEAKRAFEGQVPLARYGTNEEVARLALFLASDDASYCTGAVFVADGGFTTH